MRALLVLAAATLFAQNIPTGAFVHVPVKCRSKRNPLAGEIRGARDLSADWPRDHDREGAVGGRERHGLGALERNRQGRNRNIRTAREQGRNPLRGRDLHKLQFNPKVLGELPGRGDLGSIRLVVAVKNRTIHDILGSPDDMKFRSSMTLFDAVSANPIFAQAISAYYGGEADRSTLDRLEAMDSERPPG